MASDPPTAATTTSSSAAQAPSGATSHKPTAGASSASAAQATAAPSGRTAHSSSADPGQAPTSPATPAPVPSASSAAAEGEKEKDENSFSSTTGTTAAHDARRTANKSSGSDPGTTGTPTTAKPTASSPANGASRSAAPRRKKSFLSKIKGAFTFCIGPSAAHPVDTDEIVAESTPKPAEPAPAPPAAVAEPSPPVPAPAPVTEKAPAVVEKAPPTPVEEPAPATPVRAQPEPVEQPSPVVTPPTPPPAASEIKVTPPPPEVEVIVPPSPTKSIPPEEETMGMTSTAVQPAGSTGEPEVDRHSIGGSTDITTDSEVEEQPHLDEDPDDEDRLIMNGGAGIPIGPDGVPRPLLPPLAPQHAGRKCLVLDLDETLVHSSFKSIQHADYVVPVEIEYHWHNVYVIKRPGVDNFLKKMGELYEIVVFTASLSKYADPVLDKLDIHRVVTHRLFRESCYNHKGNYVKDLSQLGRPIADTIILDNSPASYIFHPNNAVPVSSWFNDPHDTELTDLVPFLADLTVVDDVRGILDGGL